MIFYSVLPESKLYFYHYAPQMFKVTNVNLVGTEYSVKCEGLDQQMRTFVQTGLVLLKDP